MVRKKVDYKNLVVLTIKQKYPYFLGGVLILIVIYLFTTNLFFKNKVLKFNKPQPTPTQITLSKETSEKTYQVKKGDTLWKIAEETYGSGYNAYDIALANQIKNPNLIVSGQKLILPSVTPKKPTGNQLKQALSTSQTKITENKYTVKKGDYLWKIALEAYGDGYAWVKIAKVNKLKNPNLIHPGNILIIPR